MRILHLSSHYSNVGGQEQHIDEVSRLLRRSGHEAHVIFGKRDGVPFDDPVPSTYLADVDEDGPPRRVVNRQAREVVATLAPDLIYLHGALNTTLCAALAAQYPTLKFVHGSTSYCLGTKLLRTVTQPCTLAFTPRCILNAYVYHCGPRRPVGLISQIRQTLAARATISLAHRIVVASNYMRDVLIQNGVERERIAVLPYFLPLPPESELRPLPADGPIVFIGRLTDEKGAQVLLRAMAELPGDVRATVIGDGWYLPALKEITSQLGLSERVDFPGWLAASAVRRHIQESRAVVVPSLWPEPFGIIGIEAMAWARPVIASAVGGIADWLEHERTGLLVEPNDPRQLAAAVTALLGDPEKAQTFGTRGRQIAEARFTPERHLGRLLELMATTVEEWRNRRGSTRGRRAKETQRAEASPSQ